jgi:hypothetical protein
LSSRTSTGLPFSPSMKARRPISSALVSQTTALILPVERQVSGAKQPATAERGRLASLNDGSDDVGCQVAQASEPAPVERAVV